jgi:hypothetical protein
MAMKPCLECGTPVSTSAKVCPNCGKRKPTKKSRGCLYLLAGLGLLVVIGLLYDPQPSSQTGDPQSPSVGEGTGRIRVGAKLYDANGQFWATVVGIKDSHVFPNGIVEPAVLVDYGPRMGDPPVPPQWFPRRSAERFTIK